MRIGAFSLVGPDVELGDDVELVSHVAVAGHTRIGPGTRIWPFASIGHRPQDLKYAGETSYLEIGARNMIREHVTMNPGTTGGGLTTRIGDGGLFMMGAHVGHDCQLGDNVIMANNATLAGHVEIGDFAFLGGLCAVHQFVRIGAHSMVGGMTGVEKDVIPFGTVIGNRAELGGLNIIGLRRRGFDRETIRALRDAYREVFYGPGALHERAAAAGQRHAEVGPGPGDGGLHPGRHQPELLHAPGRLTAMPDSGGAAGPPPAPPTPLAIIAGRGTLPQRIAERRAASALPYLLVIFPGCFEPWMTAHPHQHHEFEKPGRLFRALRAAGATHVVFAGAMTRPRLRPWRADLKAVAIAARAFALLRRGDDAMLRGFAGVFESEGLVMLGPHDVLGGQAMVSRGALGAKAPGAQDRADAARAARIVAALGPLDVGQGAVVARGLCLAVEAIEGTDLMLARLADLPPDRRAAVPPPSGVLYKGPKPGQDRRLDLPAIGPRDGGRRGAGGPQRHRGRRWRHRAARRRRDAGGRRRGGRFRLRRSSRRARLVVRDMNQVTSAPDPSARRRGRRRPCRGMTRRFYIIAGEASGDRLGGGLMRALQAQGPAEFAGIGGRDMSAAGLRPLFDMGELSVMGLTEVLPRLPNLIRRIRQTARDVVAWRPDALISIDSPDFSLRVAKAARRQMPGLPVIHYVAPSVWAWRPGRAAKMARHVDHVLALLPFEPPYMHAAGMSCDFVGHPAAARPHPSAAEIQSYREAHGLADRHVLLLAPGSRQGVIRRMMPVYLDAMARLRAEDPALAIVCPVAEGVASEVDAALALLPPPVLAVPPEASEAERRLAMAAADAALCTSGTVALEIAALAVPTVVAYRASRLTAAIVRRLIRVDTATLVNLVVGRKAVPEFLQERCTAANLAQAVRRLLADPAAAAEQRAAFDEAMAALGRYGAPPDERAARSVLDFLDRRAGVAP